MDFYPLFTSQNDVLIPEYLSDDDEPQGDVKRRRLKKLAESYRSGGRLYVATARLKGPFGPDWRNPWASARSTVPHTSEKAKMAISRFAIPATEPSPTKPPPISRAQFPPAVKKEDRGENGTPVDFSSQNTVRRSPGGRAAPIATRTVNLSATDDSAPAPVPKRQSEVNHKQLDCQTDSSCAPRTSGRLKKVPGRYRDLSVSDTSNGRPVVLVPSREESPNPISMVQKFRAMHSQAPHSISASETVIVAKAVNATAAALEKQEARHVLEPPIEDIPQEETVDEETASVIVGDVSQDATDKDRSSTADKVMTDSMSSPLNGRPRVRFEDESDSGRLSHSPLKSCPSVRPAKSSRTCILVSPSIRYAPVGSPLSVPQEPRLDSETSPSSNGLGGRMGSWSPDRNFAPALTLLPSSEITTKSQSQTSIIEDDALVSWLDEASDLLVDWSVDTELRKSSSEAVV